jgi:flavin-dependent dehydrogenase
VIGGGLAGSMLAIRLAAAGREVLLVEREREAHDKVCGEFLSREAIAYLGQAGIDARELGARAIQRVRLVAGSRAVEARLPFTALSLSRKVLDERLLERAQQAGCALRRGVFVERLEASEGGWRLRLRGGESVEAKMAFLATGKHDVIAWERNGGRQTDLVGFKMHWKLEPGQTEMLRGVMELILFRGGYGGLSLIEGETANLCVVVRRKRLRELGGWTHFLAAMQQECPALRDRLRGAVACWLKPLAVSPIPYGYLRGTSDGMWRVGDQAAVIPSFTGDGMSIALHSGALAAEMYLKGKSAEQYARCLEGQLRAGMRFASGLSRAMVTNGGRWAAPFLMASVPGAMATIAALTRIPDAALLHAGVVAQA